MDKILPPVSEWQIVQLSLCLAIMAVAVKDHTMPFPIDDSFHDNFFRRQHARMTSLLDVCLSSKYPSRARSDAATSIYWMLRQYHDHISTRIMSTDDNKHRIEFFAISLIETSLYVEIRRRLESTIDSSQQNCDNHDNFLDDVKDSLQIAVVVVRKIQYSKVVSVFFPHDISCSLALFIP
jgi:hypothetical protein